MALGRILALLKGHAGTLRVQGFSITVSVSPARMDAQGLKGLYRLLNGHEDRYFIRIYGVPSCLMPGAEDHTVYARSPEGTYRRIPACSACSLAAKCPGWDARFTLDAGLARPLRDVPQEIVMEITSRCNNACLTCTRSSAGEYAMSEETMAAITREAQTLGIPALRFTGGEPLLNPGLQHMLAYAKSRNFYVLLNTNATLLDRASLAYLRRSVDNVLVSLQGHNAQSNAWLTSDRGPFERKLAGISSLRKRIPVLRIGTVISRTLLRNFPAYARLVRSLGADIWELYRPVTSQPHPEFTYPTEALHPLLRLILGLKKKGMDVKIANPLPFCLFKDMDAAASVMLGAIADDGNSRIVWDARGYYKPSYFIDRDLGRDIMQAWGSSFLRALRATTYLPQQCRDCVYLKWCKGGSRALAKISSGSYFRPDPLFPSR